ncbi:hypothetical protein KR018_007965 [Drosophila ironensis]|nr:hypothetical protein KR018_007965 [Drosophila ironensis]
MQSIILLCILVAFQTSFILADEDIDTLTAHEIHNNLNASAQPCSDFWNFACGGFRNASEYVDNFEWVEDQYANAMRDFLESRVAVHDEQTPRLLAQMRTYYKACTTDQLNWTSNHPTDSLMQGLSLGNKFRGLGVNGILFDEHVDVATNDSLQRVVQIQMPAWSTRYSVHRALQAIRAHEWEYKEEMIHLVEELQKLQDKYRVQEPMVETWRFRELTTQIPNIGWDTFMRLILGENYSKDELRELLFEVSDVAYLREMGQLLRDSDSRALQQYIRVRQMVYVRQSAPLKQNPKYCIHHMRALLPLGMDYIYNRFLYKNREQDTQKLQEIFIILKKTFAKYLDANRLQLTTGQLEYLRAKLREMQLKVGNLPEESSPEFYNNHYQSAHFTETNFLDNLIEALALRNRLQHEGLLESGARLDLKRYYVNDNVVKARTSPFYENERNTITVPLVFLQWPLFDHRQHSVFQHSLIGAVVAHEMNHGFEQEGVLFDAAGNESPVGLEIRESKHFQDAIKCAQRKPFVSLKERLADLNGLQLAYDAFFGLHHDSRQFEYRPYSFEREFPAPQLFLLSYAQFFCGRLPPVIGHDRDDERVNVSVGNLRQFAYDFKCEPSTEQSSPICEMWRPRDDKQF